VVSRFARDHRLPYETPSGVDARLRRCKCDTFLIRCSPNARNGTPQ
jgi:hypothetical protein